jgi:hypothetical protein
LTHNLFERCLAPEGTVISSDGVRGTGVAFWERMRGDYHGHARRQTLRSDRGEQHMMLFRLQRKTAT